MKKITILFLIGLILIVGCGGNQTVEFGTSDCSDDLKGEVGNYYGEWTDSTTLEIDTIIELNCAEEVESVDVDIGRNELKLIYSSPVCDESECVDCLCYKTLKYKISNLEEKNYTIVLERK